MFFEICSAAFPFFSFQVHLHSFFSTAEFLRMVTQACASFNQHLFFFPPPLRTFQGSSVVASRRWVMVAV